MVTTASTFTANIIMMLFLLILLFAAMTVVFTGFWRVYVKLGIVGWYSLIPFFNIWVLCGYFYKHKARAFLFLIPVANLVFLFLIDDEISKAFHMYVPFTLGLFFLNPIFIAIAGFSREIKLVEENKSN